MGGVCGTISSSSELGAKMPLKGYYVTYDKLLKHKIIHIYMYICLLLLSVPLFILYFHDKPVELI